MRARRKKQASIRSNQYIAKVGPQIAIAMFCMRAKHASFPQSNRARVEMDQCIEVAGILEIIAGNQTADPDNSARIVRGERVVIHRPIGGCAWSIMAKCATFDMSKEFPISVINPHLSDRNLAGLTPTHLRNVREK